MQFLSSRTFVFSLFTTLLVGGNPIAAGAEGCFSAPYSCYPPGDISPQTPRQYAPLASAYADMAWQDFLALNSPAATDASGNYLPQPSTVNGLNYNSGNYVAVWQTWTEARELFLPNGAKPDPFGSGHNLPAKCLALGRSDVTMLLSRSSKAGEVAAHDTTRDKVGAPKTQAQVLDEYVQALRMGPVVDQNGQYVRFGLNFNGTMYDYVVDNVLYNKEGQEAFDSNDPNHDKNPVDWPRGQYQGAVGSLFVKSSWKILGNGDNPGLFHRVTAYIYDEAGGPFGDEPTVEERCTVEEVGLVGFHIVHRSNSAPQWVWSTFEHYYNAPWLVDFRAGTPPWKYSFFNQATCPPVGGMPSCAYNSVPAQPWNPQRPGQTPTQIVRIAAPGDYAESANGVYQNALRMYFGGTVWENYFLVDVQFPTVVDVVNPATGLANENPAYPDGVPSPSFLANSTLETYIQGVGQGAVTTNGNAVPYDDQMQNIIVNGPVVNPFQRSIFNESGGSERLTSSCVSCHYDAAMTNGTNANFVFSLSRAQSTQTASTEPTANPAAEKPAQ